MNRIERYHEQHTKPFFLNSWILFAVFICGLIITANIYLKSQIKIEAPKVELGRQVIIQLPNAKEIQTYEGLIVEKDGKLYYKGDRNTIDITGGTVVYQDWK
jgi:hypothetical protein